MKDIIEKIAADWDGCMYDAPGEAIDIGAAIRREYAKLAPPPSPDIAALAAECKSLVRDYATRCVAAERFSGARTREGSANAYRALVAAIDRLAAQAQAPAQQQLTWPTARDVCRHDDMGQGSLRLLLDSDNDAIVEVWPTAGAGRRAAVEFCNPGGGGGGRSSRTRSALIALMVAIEADNAESPLPQPPQEQS